MIRAVYPGTFDPLTRGHEDLVRRAARRCDQLIIGVAISRGKSTFFTLQERTEMAREVLGDLKNVQIASFSGLLA
jgi:pantetheine-phosphate adenylyltransferase